ncbi:unnamed protein product [Candidula unifasciata]|uniref:Cytochrome c oxidase subunit n=1 Tax=Candidula unifasciata TaxID=100452 RepID=A0A8S3Z2U3_9EUPU|nr:unnamed protein product [Candidula unifasciata]
MVCCIIPSQFKAKRLNKLTNINLHVCRRGDNQSSCHSDRWRIMFFAGLTAVGLLHLFVYTTMKHEERPEFVAYPHLRLRGRPFPWGDGNHTLFHNCEKNALPDGYEDCECGTKH